MQVRIVEASHFTLYGEVLTDEGVTAVGDVAASPRFEEASRLRLGLPLV